MLLDDLSDTPSGPSPRHRTVQVRVGDGASAVLVGGGAPIVVQSMTNTDTADIEGTVQQVAALARAGSELVRITVDRDEAAAESLRGVAEGAGFSPRAQVIELAGVCARCQSAAPS